MAASVGVKSILLQSANPHRLSLGHCPHKSCSIILVRSTFAKSAGFNISQNPWLLKTFILLNHFYKYKLISDFTNIMFVLMIGQKRLTRLLSESSHKISQSRHLHLSFETSCQSWSLYHKFLMYNRHRSFFCDQLRLLSFLYKTEQNFKLYFCI